MKKIYRQEEGQGLMEYALVILLIALVVILILTFLGPTISGFYARVIGGLNGQQISGSGDEVAVDGSANITGDGVCTATLPAGTTIIALRDGRTLGNTSVTIQIWANGSSGSSIAVATDSNGRGTTGADLTASDSCPVLVSYTMTAPP